VTRRIYFAASLLAAATVAGAGLIGFVGLIVPAIARALGARNTREAILASALAGAALVVLADLAARTVVVDLSTDPYDRYEPDLPRATAVLWPDDTADDYLTALTELLAAVPWERIGLVLHNGGMDPFPRVGRDDLVAREHLVATTCADRGVPCAFVLAGGYTVGQTLAELVDLHLATVRAFRDARARDAGRAGYAA
jgi:hypothetical protein